MSTAPEARRKGDRTFLYVALAFVVFWGIYLAFFMPPMPGPQLNTAMPPIPADFGWSPSDVDGNPVDFAKFKGRPVFLNVWATWCGPCLSEMPSIAKLAANPRLKGKVDFLCVSVDDRREKVKSFVADKGWPMTVLHVDELPEIFRTDGIPATFIINPQGQIVKDVTGSMDWDKPEFVELLEKLIVATP